MEVTVVVPTYNRSLLIGETLQSILTQQCPPTELIVVDDGSTDDTESVVRSFDGPIRYVRTENAGESNARNRGVGLATCPWIALCDSDDLWLPQHLATHGRIVDRYPGIKLTFSNFVIVRDGRWGTEDKFSSAPAGYWEGGRAVDGGWIFDEPLYERLLRFQPIFQSNIVISREYFQSVGGYDPTFARTLSQDLDFDLRCVESGPVGAITAATVGIRKHAGNFSGSLLRTLQGELTILRHARQAHRLGQKHRGLIDNQIVERTIAAADLAFATAELDTFQELVASLPPTALTFRLRTKRAVTAFPRRLAVPVARTLSAARSYMTHRQR